MSEITVIGSFVADSVATMDKFPEAGQTVLGKTIACYPGGKGVNQCVAAARLGGDVQMIGMLGKDANGEMFKKVLKEDNIKADKVFLCDMPTATAQIQIESSGQNRICVIPSANYELGFDELEKFDIEIKNSRIILLQLELRADVTFEIIRRAYSYHKTIILNPAPAIKLEQNILDKLDYITPNETELKLLTDMPTNTQEEIIAATSKLLSLGVKNVIVTLGSKGAYVADMKSGMFVKGYNVQAVDTVAAGDSFNGAFAVALTEGKNIEEAVKFANAEGALTVMTKGAIPSLRYRADVDKFIADNN